MRQLQKKTYWIDRLFAQEEQASLPATRVMEQVGEWVYRHLSRYFHHETLETSFVIKDLDRKLQLIGWDKRRLAVWRGSLAMTGLLLGLLFYIATAKILISPLIFVIPVMMLAGYLLPDLYITDREQQVELAIHNDFPRFLDLLHLYTSSAAFENMGSAIYYVANNMKGTLAEQLRELTSLYRFVDRTTFLEEMERRFSTPLAKDLVATIKLTEQYGGNISTKIGILADEAHKERLQNAKKAGQKAAATLLVPLMLFHFPVAVIIFLAPTAIALKEVFGW